MGDSAGVLESLDRLVLAHDSAGSPLRHSLRDGYEGDLTGAFLDDNFSLHSDIAALFSWHDGIDWGNWNGAGTPSLFPFYGEFHNFDAASETQNVFLDDLDGDNESSFWRVSWFPVLKSASSNTFVVECDAGSPDFGSVWLSSLSSLSFEYVVVSLGSLINSIIGLFEEGRFEYSIGGITTSPEVGSDVVISWLRGEADA